MRVDVLKYINGWESEKGKGGKMEKDKERKVG